MAKKVILVPYPAQGHVTPMLKLALALLNQGLAPLLVVPEFIHRRISPQIKAATGGRIPCVAIPDGLDEEGHEAGKFFAVEMAMEKIMPLQLQRVVLDHHELQGGGGGGGGGVACMVVDLLASYAINVGNVCGVEVVGFWPAMFATYRLIASIPKMVEAGIISDSGCPLQEASVSLVPGQPTISTTEMPWLIGTSTARKLRFKFWKRTLERSTTLRSLLVNTFPEECKYPNNYNSKENPLKIIPIRQPMDYGTINSNSNTIGSFWEEDLSCLEWLDKQSPGSVIYISFGSWVSPIGDAKVKALALALEASRRPFLWVLGPPWRKGLPKNFIDKTTTSEEGRGKLVSWAPQVQVLRHEGVGCYLTHCGWNSTMEAIECKKRLLCYPVAGDQFLNCAYIVNAWRIGVRLNGFGERELDERMKRMMEDREMSERIVRLNERLMGNWKESCCTTHLATFVKSVIRR